MRRQAVDALSYSWDGVEEATRLLQQDPAKLGSVLYIELLGTISDRRVVEALVDSLEDEDASVRSAAAAGVGTARALPVSQALVAALNTGSGAERVVGVLGRIGVSDVTTEGRSPRSVLELNKAIRRWQKAAATPLIIALNDHDATVRQAAADALERIGGPEAERALAEYRARQ